MHIQFRYIFLVSLLALLCVSCGREPAKKILIPSGKIVKIGVIGPMTGEHAKKGQSTIEGIKTAMHIMPLLYNGDKIELILEDDEDDPKLAVKAFEKLVDEDNVTSILIFSSSRAVIAVDKIADRYKVPTLVLTASHPSIAERTHYVHQLCFDDAFQGDIAALYSRDELLVTDVAVVVDYGDPHLQSLSEVFTEKFKSIGGTVVDTVRIDSATSNLEYSLKTLQKEGVELLYMPVSSENFIKISKIIEDLNWDVLRMGSDGLMTTVFAKYHDDLHLLEGIYGIDFYSSNMKLTSKGNELKKLYHKLFSGQITTYTAAGAEGYAILFSALNQCENVNDKSVINQRIGETVDFEGVMGKITILPNGKARRPLFVNTVKNEELKFLVKVY